MFVSLGTVSMLALPGTVSAQTGANPAACGRSVGGFLSFPTWYKYLNPRIENGACQIDFEFPKDIGPVLLAVFEIMLRIAGVLAIIFIIWGGIQYQLSQGEPDRLSGARSVIINALIGLAVSISAVGIVNLVGRNIG